MLTPQEFVDERIGKGVDVDGAYGTQCWDLFAYFCRLARYPLFNCTKTGYVKDIWTQRHTSGILNYFDEVPLDAIQDGDWVIWDNSKVAPDSHLAMFTQKVNNNAGIFLGQNQNGIATASLVQLSYEGIMGVLRPKVYGYSTSLFPIPTKGSAVALYDEIRVRNIPSLIKGDSGSRYQAQMKVNYDSVVVADGWYWLSYVSYSGIRRYVAYGSIDGKHVYWKIER